MEGNLTTNAENKSPFLCTSLPQKTGGIVAIKYVEQRFSTRAAANLQYPKLQIHWN